MRKQVILSLRVAWTVAVLVTLIMGIAVCESSAQACLPAGDTIVAFMAVATFPTGIVCLIVSAIVSGFMSGDLPSGYLTAWLVMACGGCLQWYVIVPLLLQEPKLTLLNLNDSPATHKTNVTKVTGTDDATTGEPQVVTASVIQSPRKPRERKRHHQVLAFDKFGRTPLERVINRSARDASA